jgi:hypothetical protein
MNEDIFFINSLNKNRNKNINSNSEYIESTFTKDLTTDYYNKFRDTYISIDNRDKNKYYSNNNCEIDFNKNFENVENIELIDINLSNSNPPVLNNTLTWKYITQIEYDKNNVIFTKNPTNIFPNTEIIHSISIDDGFYTVSDLEIEIMNKMNSIQHDSNEKLPSEDTINTDTPSSKNTTVDKTQSLHQFYCNINPITNNVTFINRLENIKIYAIQTLLNENDDKLGDIFGVGYNQTVGDLKVCDTTGITSDISNGIYIYIGFNDLFYSLFNDDNSSYESDILSHFSIPIIPTDIPSIGGINNEIINNKEYYLLRPEFLSSLTPAININEKKFFPNDDYTGHFFQPMGLIKIGLADNFNYINSPKTNLLPTNLMRIKLQLLDENNQKVNVKFNETIYTDEKLAKFMLLYDPGITNQNSSDNKYYFNSQSVIGHSIQLNKTYPIIGRSIPFKFVIDENSILNNLGWYTKCDEVIVSDKDSYRTIQSNKDFIIDKKENILSQDYVYKQNIYPKINYIFNKINDEYFIKLDTYILLKIINDNNDNFTLTNNNINGIFSKIILSNIPNNSSNKFIKIKYGFEKGNLYNFNKINLEFIDYKGNIINYNGNFSLVIKVRENLNILRDSYLNSQNNNFN